MERKSKKIFKQHLTVLILFFSPSLALANDGDMISGFLRGLINILTSGPARLLFVIAIIHIGYATLVLGKIPKERAIAYVIGIGMVFSAFYIAKKMGVGS